MVQFPETGENPVSILESFYSETPVSICFYSVRPMKQLLALFLVLALLLTCGAASILLADVMENVQLLNLTAQLSLGGGLESALARLHLFTWLKWGGLAVYFLLIGNYFREQSGIWRFVWVLAGAPAIFALWAFLLRGPTHELMALSIGVLFLVLTLFAWRQTVIRGSRAYGA